MKTFSLLFFLISCLLVPVTLYAFGGCEQDCFKCHNLSKDQALTVLKPLFTDAQIEKVAMAPAKGLWEVIFKTGGRNTIAYVDFSLQNVIFGQIVQIKTRQNLTQEKMMNLNRVDFTSIPLDDALVIGKPSSRHKVVVFSDPECPFCAKLHQELKHVIEKRKDIAFYIKLYPLPMHKDSRRKSESIICSKSLRKLDDAFEHRPISDPTCKTDKVENNIELAKKLGITGTPALVFEDGRLYPGFLQAETIIQFVDKK